MSKTETCLHAYDTINKLSDADVYRIKDIDECIAGGEVVGGADSSCLLTIVSKVEGASRILAVSLPSAEERNLVLTGLRYANN